MTASPSATGKPLPTPLATHVDDVQISQASLVDSRRGRRSSKSRAARWAIGLAVLVACYVVASMLLWFGSSHDESRRKTRRQTPIVLSPMNEATDGDTDDDRATIRRMNGTQEAHAPPHSSANIAERLDAIERAVVRIEAIGPGEATTLGSGFIIGQGGLVATNYHVMAEATAARARFSNGAAYDIAGYAALDPADDLAIVRLADPPGDLQSIALRGDADPSRLDEVVAIGHPQGIDFSPVDGRVSRVVRTSELPSRSRQFLRNLIGADSNHRWIQHTAPLSPGNSGGPLLNQQGEAVGVNTWVDQEARLSYALHADHLERLHSTAIETGSAVAPLARYARKEARVAALLAELSADQIDRLCQEAKRFNFRPQSESDYETLEQLAWAVTVANLPNTLIGPGGLEGERLRELIVAADRCAARLRAEKWDQIGQLLLVNERAAERIDEPMAGVFFFGTVERVVEGSDGERAILMELAGMDRTLMLPIEGQLESPAEGSQCLVLGVNLDGRYVRFGDNPLQLVTAPVIASRTIFPLE